MNQCGWEGSQNAVVIFKCPGPPWDQNGLCVEVNLLSKVRKGRGSPKMLFIPLDPNQIEVLQVGVNQGI